MKKPPLKDMLKKKKLDPDKDANLEKGDFLALLIAGMSVFLPILIVAILVLALFIFAWVSFFH